MDGYEFEEIVADYLRSSGFLMFKLPKGLAISA